MLRNIKARMRLWVGFRGSIRENRESCLYRVCNGSRGRSLGSVARGLRGGGRSKGRKGDHQGEKMKRYEEDTERRGYLAANMPYIMRLDGHKFSTFCKGRFTKPFDKRLSEAMVLTSRDLLKYFPAATCAYVQSDEITLVFPSAQSDLNKKVLNPQTSMIHGGRLQKLSSISSGFASVRFNCHITRLLTSPSPTPSTPHAEEHQGDGMETSASSATSSLCQELSPHFDCRVFNVPDATEASQNVLWRQDDCLRNSMILLAQQHLTPKELHKVSSRDAIRLLLSKKSIRWRDMPPVYRFGSLVKREKFDRVGHNPITGEETKAVRYRFVALSLDLFCIPNTLLWGIIHDPNLNDAISSTPLVDLKSGGLPHIKGPKNQQNFSSARSYSQSSEVVMKLASLWGAGVRGEEKTGEAEEKNHYYGDTGEPAYRVLGCHQS
mmetsp:Transcript_6421/g.8834  ORF Transcript_6421/g.8834 Transcript_6421/m.8834 type:complete len:436 (+) Transcript_6421:233-1540(+)